MDPPLSLSFPSLVLGLVRLDSRIRPVRYKGRLEVDAASINLEIHSTMEVFYHPISA